MQAEEAVALRDLLVEQVAQGRFTVVLSGVTSDMLPGLDDSQVLLRLLLQYSCSRCQTSTLSP